MSRRVLITGGASGLGAALAAQLAARGDRVLVTDLAPSYDVPEGPGSPERYLRLNVTSDGDWEAARAWVEREWGGLDLLVNNAGIATGGRIDVATIEEWWEVVDINLLGVVRGCRTFTPMLKAQGSGQIVNTASLAGLVHPPAMASYTAVKAGVVALSETLAYELAPWGIAVSAVCPGFFRTNLAASLHGSDAALDKIAARLIDRSKLDATQVAREVIKGIDGRRMVILPDPLARRTWLTKRFARPLYDRAQRRFGARIRAITTRSTEDNGDKS
ncbi:MAG: SDR family NAD(P)-dependent oxidoreductase [Nocardioides sp.]|uniref:SDR family NAD(P)-dependent oxidoreductase n=1 Tax=Nocardioides sp. TaxID=35761 RepID=UPI0039E63876